MSQFHTASTKKWFESHCWLGLSTRQPRQNWPINSILLRRSVEWEIVLLVLLVPMTPFHNVRGFVFPSLKPRNLTPRMSLLSYWYRKRSDHLTPFLRFFSLVWSGMKERRPIYFLINLFLWYFWIISTEIRLFSFFIHQPHRLARVG